MATGVHIVGSSNSGMIEMLGHCSSIFESGNEKDLAIKIEKEYKSYQQEEVNHQLRKRLKNQFSSELICSNMLKYYKSTIQEYQESQITKEDIRAILEKIHIETRKLKKISYKKLKDGVANYVYRVKLKGGKKYIIKKYIYSYNFEYSKKLYYIYEKNNISVVSPINQEIITHNSCKYNVFPFHRSIWSQKIDNDYITKILICDRKTNYKSSILKKILLYYNYLINNKCDLLRKDELDYVIKQFNSIKDNPIFEEKYLNHGDISIQNIIITKSNSYLIDFDETTITTKLYDFAVVMVKIYSNKEQFDYNKFLYLRNKIKENSKYQNKDFTDTIKFYLCKILLEKFYLHQISKINLFSKRQQKDFYIRYISLLKDVERLEIL